MNTVTVIFLEQSTWISDDVVYVAHLYAGNQEYTDKNGATKKSGWKIGCKGFFRAAKKAHISTHLSSAFCKKSALPSTFFDAWEGVLLIGRRTRGACL